MTSADSSVQCEGGSLVAVDAPKHACGVTLVFSADAEEVTRNQWRRVQAGAHAASRASAAARHPISSSSLLPRGCEFIREAGMHTHMQPLAAADTSVLIGWWSADHIRGGLIARHWGVALVATSTKLRRFLGNGRGRRLAW